MRQSYRSTMMVTIAASKHRAWRHRYPSLSWRPWLLGASLILSFIGVWACTSEVAETGSAASEAARFERTNFETELARLKTSVADDVRLAIWFGTASGESLYELNPHEPFPAASAIKTAYLVELVHHFRTATQPNELDGLDQPILDASTYLSSSHPAVAHFDADTQREIASYLTDAPVREIGRMMIRAKRLNGDGEQEDVSNAVYNAAANLTTAALGGPKELTRRIHARDPDFAGIASRRYMLAARDITGDNEASAFALARVWSRIASASVAGLSTESLKAVEEILYLDEDDVLGAHYYKGGSLNSSPLARIASGYWSRGSDEPLVYVIMSRRPGPGGERAESAGEAMATFVDAIRSSLRRAVR